MPAPSASPTATPARSAGHRNPRADPGRTLAALCDILDCTPNDLFEPFVEMTAAATADAPRRSEDLGVTPRQPIARRVKLVTRDE